MDIRCLCRRFLTFALTVLTITVSVSDGRGRGGGSRGGFRSGGSRSRSSSSGVRYSSSSYARSGSRISSTYVSYVPSVRYTRAYSSSRIGSGYWYYYGLYFGYARSSYYVRRRRYGYDDDVSVCVNYESDTESNGTTLGIFTCPLLDEEPRSYTKCCGDQYAEYCCEKTNEVSAGVVIGIILAILMGVGICVAVFLYCKRKKPFKGRVIDPPPIERRTQMQIHHIQPSDNGVRYRSQNNADPTGIRFNAGPPPEPYPYGIQAPPYSKSPEGPEGVPQYPITPYPSSGGESMPKPTPLYPPTQPKNNLYQPQPLTFPPYPTEPPPEYRQTSV